MGEIAEMMLCGEMTEDGEYIGPIPKHLDTPIKVLCERCGHRVGEAGLRSHMASARCRRNASEQAGR